LAPSTEISVTCWLPVSDVAELVSTSFVGRSVIVCASPEETLGRSSASPA
jgi:hypothetical protein